MPIIDTGYPVSIVGIHYWYWVTHYRYWKFRNWCNQYWYWTHPVSILGVPYWSSVKIIANPSKGCSKVQKLSIWEHYQYGKRCKNPSIGTGHPLSKLASRYWKKGQLMGPAINTGTAHTIIDAGSSIIYNGRLSIWGPTYITSWYIYGERRVHTPQCYVYINVK